MLTDEREGAATVKGRCWCCANCPVLVTPLIGSSGRTRTYWASAPPETRLKAMGSGRVGSARTLWT